MVHRGSLRGLQVALLVINVVWMLPFAAVLILRTPKWYHGVMLLGICALLVWCALTQRSEFVGDKLEMRAGPMKSHVLARSILAAEAVRGRVTLQVAFAGFTRKVYLYPRDTAAFLADLARSCPHLAPVGDGGARYSMRT